MEVIKVNLEKLWIAWPRMFDKFNIDGIKFVAIGILLLAALTLLRRLVSVRLDALYVLGYLTLLLIWPFPRVMERLLFPLAPLILIYATITLKALFSAQAFIRPTVLTSLPLISLVGSSIYSSGLYISRTFESLPSELNYLAVSRYWMRNNDRNAALNDLRMRHAILNTARVANEIVPSADCIYTERPQLVMFYARKPSFPAGPDRQQLTQPRCHYQLLITDRSLTSAARSLWPDPKTVHVEHGPQGPAGILLEYKIKP